jgi:hypothetical protein
MEYVFFTALVSQLVIRVLLLLRTRALMANLYYVNLHSSTFTAGEIRGQLVRELQQVLYWGRLLIRHFYLEPCS